MIKSALRTIYKDKRKALSEKDRMKLDDLILIQFQQLELSGINTLLSYLPMPTHHEVNTLHITDYVKFRVPGLQLAYPRTHYQEVTMMAIAVDDETAYETNNHGIVEPVAGQVLSPETLDMIFVPLLAYDKLGYRVGYGKGFYDRYLKLCRQDVVKVGFSYFEPEPVISDVNEFDIPLNFAITPDCIYEF
ncbi:MAG TPA: 5-formyltetrahydrofolate cyclo-ligase [Chitinophagaceae bacterium]|nr:5-formyltetrahydrofolate cyclo-ligase [Chitinophagaceae bacterium]